MSKRIQTLFKLAAEDRQLMDALAAKLAGTLGFSLSRADVLRHALHALAEREGVRMAASKFQTGADLVAYWQGERLIGSRPGIANSQKRARTIRQRAERRPRD